MEVIQQQLPETPVIIDISKPKSGDPTGLSDVLIGALGLSAAIVLLAVLVAGLLAGALFFWRSRRGLDVPDTAETRDERFITLI